MMENKALLKLLQTVDTFHQRAMRALALVKLAAEAADDPVLTAAEDLWDQTDNKELADMLENLMSSYRQFNDAIKKVPTNEELDNPRESADEDAETVGDIIDALNARWQRLVNNPYLQKDADDPSYTESEPAYKYLEVAEALVNKANQALENRTGGVVSPEELKRMQEQVSRPEIAEPETTEAEAYWKAKKRAYDEAFRTRMQEARSIGVANLARARDQIMQQISSTTNEEHKKDLMGRLKQLPNPDTYQNYVAALKRGFENILADPARKEKYWQENAKRNAKRIAQNKQIFDLLDRYQASQDPSEKARILKALVSAKEDIERRKGKNLDDPFVRESPLMKKLLDPMNILQEYTGRQAGIQKYRAQEVLDRQQRRQAGEMPGLFDIYKQDLATLINELKRAIGRKIDSTGPNDPVFKPYFEAVKQAPDAAARAKAEEALKAFAKHYKENHPLVLETAKRLEGLVKVRDELAEILSARRKGKDIIFKNPWVGSSDPAPVSVRPQLAEIVRQLRAHLGIGLSDLRGVSDFEGDIRNLAEAIEARMGGT